MVEMWPKDEYLGNCPLESVIKLGSNAKVWMQT